MVKEKTNEMEVLLNAFDENVIASKTDLDGKITYASKAFCKITGYSEDELIGSNHNIIRHPDMEKEVFEDMWRTILAGDIWKGEIKNLKKDGSFYWVEAIVSPQFNLNGEIIGYSAIRQNLT